MCRDVRSLLIQRGSPSHVPLLPSNRRIRSVHNSSFLSYSSLPSAKSTFSHSSSSPVSSTSLQSSTSSSSSFSLEESQQNEIPAKRVVKGSEPEFALPDDSTIETPWQRLVLQCHFLALAANLGLGFTALGTSPSSLLMLGITIALSIVVGDFATGVFHWSVDNYGSIKTPIFGSVCVAFQGHHDSPWTITFRSFANNVFKICYASIPALILLAISPIPPLSRIFFSLFINWWMISQELHKYAHMKSVPAPWKTLQDYGIILSKKEHGLHHTSPFEGHYCILTGVCNGILDRTNFFRYLERLVFKLTGNIPNTWKADSSLQNIY